MAAKVSRRNVSTSASTEIHSCYAESFVSGGSATVAAAGAFKLCKSGLTESSCDAAPLTRDDNLVGKLDLDVDLECFNPSAILGSTGRVILTSCGDDAGEGGIKFLRAGFRAPPKIASMLSSATAILGAAFQSATGDGYAGT